MNDPIRDNKAHTVITTDSVFIINYNYISMTDKTIIEEEGANTFYFDETCLKNLVIKMGFSEQSVFFEQGSQKVHIYDLNRSADL